MNIDTFMGHDVPYWRELEKKAMELGAVDLIEEIAQLRGKVSFYEDRITQLTNFMNRPNQPLKK